jgi:hypothetical protein
MKKGEGRKNQLKHLNNDTRQLYVNIKSNYESNIPVQEVRRQNTSNTKGNKIKNGSSRQPRRPSL